MVKQPFASKAEAVKFKTTANKLYKTLLPNEIAEHVIGKKLTIATDGILHNIPFDALVVNKEQSLNESFLIHDVDIHYVYSFSHLRSNSEINRQPEHWFLGIAPKNYKQKNLDYLPHSINEINDVNNLFSGDVFIEQNATKLSFTENINKYKIIHIATHSGVSDTEEPWLAFYDKKLQSKELYGMQNQSDMVVLSACKTSRGNIVNGEGVMSMARGFFHSGANSIVSSLWNINDYSGSKIMTSFYNYLSEGETKSSALRTAKLEYLKHSSLSELSPYYWGAFILIGDNSVLNIPKSNNGMYYVLLGVLIIGIVIIIARRKTQSKV